MESRVKNKEYAENNIIIIPFVFNLTNFKTKEEEREKRKEKIKPYQFEIAEFLRLSQHVTVLC